MSNTLFKQTITSPILRYFGRRKEGRCFSKAPILIGGCARSGTSLLLSILSAHPKIFCFPNETDAFTEWKDSKPVRIDRMYRSLLLNNVPKGAARWCEKRPYNVRFIKEILEYFGPKARFIHIVRDPRAVCTSVHPTNPNDYWVGPERWIRDTSAGLEYIKHPQVLTVKYEDLIVETQVQIQRICTFIEEEYGPEIENWYKHARVQDHPSWFERISTIHRESLKKWKKPEHAARLELVIGNAELVQTARRLGYDVNL